MKTLHIRTVWSRETEPDTYRQHNNIILKKRKVYWGVICPPELPIYQLDKESISAIETQIKEGIKTYLFVKPLDHEGDHFWGEISRIETGSFSWKDNILVPQYYKKSNSGSKIETWLELKEFEKTPSALFDKVRSCNAYDGENYLKYGGWVFPGDCNFTGQHQLDECLKTGEIKLAREIPGFLPTLDFLHISYQGVEYFPTPTQAKLVEYLYKKVLEGYLPVHQSIIMKDLKIGGTRLENIFKPDPSEILGRLILQGPRSGYFRLNVKM